MLTEGLIHTHGCLTKNNGERCARMLPFEIRPTTQREKKPTGDEYRQSLKKRKKRK
jgi:hypothetical protein